jgi:hypothetical protein
LFGTIARLSLVATSLVAGCGHVAAGDDLLLSGTVERQTDDHTDNTPLTGAADTHAVIELRRYEGEDGVDPLVLAVDQPVHGLPFDFDLRGDAALAFPDASTELLVSVTMFQHAGTSLRIGDLMSESRISITRAGHRLTIEVGGVEACGAANAGGICSDR